MNLEVADFSDTNKNDAEVANETHGILHYNSEEGNTTVANEKCGMLHVNFDEESVSF